MQTIKAVVVGDGCAAYRDGKSGGNLKTAFIISYVTNKYPQEYVPTVSEYKTLHWLLAVTHKDMCMTLRRGLDCLHNFRCSTTTQ